MHKQIQLLKENGFAVYQNPSCPNYVFYVKNDMIGYMQENRNGSFSISTVHQPNRETGTGFRVYDEITSPTVEEMEKGAFIFAPAWAKEMELKTVKKRKSFTHLVNSHKSYYSQLISL